MIRASVEWHEESDTISMSVGIVGEEEQVSLVLPAEHADKLSIALEQCLLDRNTVQKWSDHAAVC